MTTREAGWYDDPQDANLLRYWDGVMWTEHTSPRQKPGLDQAGAGYGQGTYAAGPGAGGQGQQGSGQPGQYGGAQGQYGAPGAPQDQYGAPGAPQGQQGQPNYPTYGAPQYGAPQGQQGGWGQPMPGGGYTGTMTGPTTPDGQPIGSWGMRLLARIIDGILVAVGGWLLSMVFMPDLMTDYTAFFEDVAAGDATTMPADLAGDFMAFSLMLAVLSIIYETLMLKSASATVGKLATGLRVRLRDQPGPLSWGTAAIRALVWFGPNLLSGVQALSFISGLFGLLNGLWPLWDSKKQSLNDKIAKTNVVKK
ncbi:RDD family protein [Ornithinimicrobium murale]|uniref:RDD family protein n=1 Tax=Ornithinimicrobium murale TaxID=1050153 RepID=UPI0013B36272|nr:RDD family protein [Ornithinimicrobium murale]